jgi:uncharacterized membrane protein YciS (DUF1049 family)
VKILNIVFSLPIILISVIFAVSNQEKITVKLWPLPFELTTQLSILILSVFAVSFILGGFFLWVNGAKKRREFTKIKKELKKAVKNLEKTCIDNKKLRDEILEMKTSNGLNSSFSNVSKIKKVKIV